MRPNAAQCHPLHPNLVLYVPHSHRLFLHFYFTPSPILFFPPHIPAALRSLVCFRSPCSMCLPLLPTHRSAVKGLLLSSCPLVKGCDRFRYRMEIFQVQKYPWKLSCFPHPEKLAGDARPRHLFMTQCFRSNPSVFAFLSKTQPQIFRVFFSFYLKIYSRFLVSQLVLWDPQNCEIRHLRKICLPPQCLPPLRKCPIAQTEGRHKSYFVSGSFFFSFYFAQAPRVKKGVHTIYNKI